MRTRSEICRRGRRHGRAAGLTILVSALVAALLTACAGELPTGSWRADGEDGRQLIIAKDADGYRMAFPGSGGWLVLEPDGDAYVTTLRVTDPVTGEAMHSERFKVRYDEDRGKLVLWDEYLDTDGELMQSMDYTLTKVSDETDGPPWPQ